MSYQAVLPLMPGRIVGRPDPDAQALRCRSGVEYHEISTREALNRCTSTRMPFDWTLNPYRGCEFGCTYCYARYTHRFFDLVQWQDFETKIFVKKDAPRALRRQLRRRDLRGQAIAIGTATDPYQPAEHHYGITRSLLEVFREVEGLKLEITTKSPLIARDLDLLAELDQRHVVSVNMTITTVDPTLARRIEQHAPDPRARIRTVEKLAQEGIATTIFCMPLMPGINDGEASLRPLMEAARDAGAVDVGAAPLFLRGNSTRSRFLPWLAEEFPHLARRYRALYSWRDHLREPEKELLLAAYRRLKLEFGFPRALPGRG
jgi:DNA repair photolyase